GCTNRKDILDPAIIRPGRLDRLIYVPLPDATGRKEIFLIHSRNMKLDKKVDVDALVLLTEDCSGAEINSICTEAGYAAIRSDRTKVTMDDFIAAVDKVKAEEDTEFRRMFG
ncbi:proteasome-activating nucleotidase, partial [Candidatus Woesearchaeota archaeon]|nr:proteasome-activating nucleotidase [Candidatus Woesearchaeota archaeon]